MTLRGFFFPDIKTTDDYTKQMEKTLTEERSRYQSLLSEHLHLEEQHRDLKEEMSLSIVRGTSVFTINTPT